MAEAALMTVYAVGDTSMLYRPCVDCGQYTGNWCESECSAKLWLPDLPWADGQITPQCTACEQQFVYCHY